MEYLIDKEMCEIIINRYYDKIFKFCLLQLKNIHLAEECTQEVFFLFFNKSPKLDITDKLGSWLYASADKICKKCRSQNMINTVDIDEIADRIACQLSSPDNNPLSDIYDVLGKDDADLLIKYAVSSSDERKKLAKNLNITTDTLYKRIERIKKRLKNYLS